MNTIVNGLQISYPDLGFAFNPISVEIAGFTNANYLICKAKDFTIERDIYDDNSTIRFELSGVARTLFDTRLFHKVQREDTSLFKQLLFSIINPSDNSTLYSGVIPIVWGALQIGETYTQNKTLTYFPGYPFTVPLLVQGNSMTIESSTDGGDFKQYEYLASSDTKKYNLDISTLKPSKRIYLRTSKDEERSIFDYRFDRTFRPQKIALKGNFNITVNVADCTTDGIYLRWINQYAEYNYYLFGVGDSSTITKDKSTILDYLVTTTQLTDNYHSGTGKTIGKDIEHTTKLYAPLVDKNTFTLLQGLIKSPIVDMFAGYDNNTPQWINVSLQGGTFAQTANNLRDFECILISNKQQIQVL